MDADEYDEIRDEIAELESENKRLRAALKIAAQWVPLPHQAYTDCARRDSEIVYGALEPTADVQSAPEPSALGYATRLAESLWQKHFKQEAPDWRPLPDLLGVLTQIDNMTTGLGRVDPKSPPREHLWFRPKGLRWDCCEVCGIVRRMGGEPNQPCRGPVSVGPRADPQQTDDTK